MFLTYSKHTIGYGIELGLHRIHVIEYHIRMTLQPIKEQIPVAAKIFALAACESYADSMS
jgi:hypothetical protein